MIVAEETGEGAPEMLLAQEDDEIGALAADTAHESLALRIMPRTPRRDQDFFDSHVLHATPEVCAVDAIAIPKKIPRHVAPRECLNDLLGRPFGGWIVCYVEMKDPSPIVR